jgi:hypothetical protein
MTIHGHARPEGQGTWFNCEITIQIPKDKQIQKTKHKNKTGFLPSQE